MSSRKIFDEIVSGFDNLINLSEKIDSIDKSTNDVNNSMENDNNGNYAEQKENYAEQKDKTDYSNIFNEISRELSLGSPELNKKEEGSITPGTFKRRVSFKMTEKELKIQLNNLKSEIERDDLSEKLKEQVQKNLTKRVANLQKISNKLKAASGLDEIKSKISLINNECSVAIKERNRRKEK